jgi:hypothetical protein
MSTQTGCGGDRACHQTTDLPRDNIERLIDAALTLDTRWM